MKILYLSDNYAKDVCGTKISIYNEIKKRGIDIDFEFVHSVKYNKIHGPSIISKCTKNKYTHIFVAHTWSKFEGCTLQDINNIGVYVVGFGFSDPYGWSATKLGQYNLYATNHFQTYSNLKSSGINSCFFPTACDLSFHKNMKIEKTTDIIFFGHGLHPRFKPNTYRLDVLSKILKHFKKRKIKIFGNKWGSFKASPAISGKRFLVEINRAKLGLDLQQSHAPLAHRMFELMACGCPAITLDRPEVTTILNKDNREILTYKNERHLIKVVEYYLTHKKDLIEVATIMYNNTRKMHSIKNRVDVLLESL